MMTLMLSIYWVGLGLNFVLSWYFLRRKERVCMSYMAAYFELWKRLDGFENYKIGNHVLDIYFDKAGNPRKTLKELEEASVR